MNKKSTAWKKSRKFGDVYGGRTVTKIPDRVINRAHSIPPPGPHDETPIFIEDNPSRDYFFPIGREEIEKELIHLPRQDWETITHIWFRRFKKTEYEKQELPLAQFICGSGVRVVVLYPWPKNMRLYISNTKPTNKQLSLYSNHRTELIKEESGWCLLWELNELKDFYIQTLLFHEIGHNIDWYNRHWSRANSKRLEDFADQYAYERTSKRSIRYAPD